MIDFIRADHIHICVPPEKLQDALVFYTEVVGLKLTDRPDHLFKGAGYWMDIGDIQLHIGVEPFLGRSIRHTAFEVKDIASARTLLELNNIEILEEPVIPGRDRFAFIDPFGNRMELLQFIP
jgi:catechol 2,3-dioxygenase-like lactoylglutathione lyase family enzyme